MRFRRAPSTLPLPRDGLGNIATSESRLTEARAVARMVAVAASRGFTRPRCLGHSLALWLLLRRRGFDCHLRLGVRRVDGRCEAHAWVEAYGVSLSDPDEPRQRFAAFDAAVFPARGGPLASSAGSGKPSSTSGDVTSAT